VNKLKPSEIWLVRREGRGSASFPTNIPSQECVHSLTGLATLHQPYEVRLHLNTLSSVMIL
jgi:hypothetical protein